VVKINFPVILLEIINRTCFMFAVQATMINFVIAGRIMIAIDVANRSWRFIPLLRFNYSSL